MDRGAWWAAVRGVAKSQTQLNDLTHTHTHTHINTHILFIEGFPGGSVVKHSPAKAGGLGSILELGKSPGEENGSPL